MPSSRVTPSANLSAALLLLAVTFLRRMNLPHPTCKALLEATGATKTRAYDLAEALGALLPSLEQPVGRPAKDKSAHDADESLSLLVDISTSCLDYLYKHPGAIGRGGQRLHASSGFRQHIVERCSENPGLDIEQIARAISVPASTLREWVRDVETNVATPPEVELETKTGTKCSDFNCRDLTVQTVLDQYRTWQGAFTDFCEHLHHHHGIRLGRTAIASILEQAGQRVRKRRPGRSPDEKALRDAFSTFFPGAQWTADGTAITVFVEGERFIFNLELMVDTASGAFVGVDARDEESSDAVIATLKAGEATTGALPLALLVDNKPCNLTPEVEQALGDNLLIPATRARPQNKGHVEGAFGMFSQQAPPLRIDGPTKKERARQLVELIAQTFYGAVNMRPRKSRKGLTRIELYQAAEPTIQDIERAKVALQARLEKQRKAQLTLRERQDPKKRALLDPAFEQLGLCDPNGNVRDAISRYAIEYIASGVAIFRGKQVKQTLPNGVDGRYLLGIVKNIAEKEEGIAIAMALWDERIKARDIILEPNTAKRKELNREHADINTRLDAFVQEAFHTDTQIERHFWLDAISELIRAQPKDQHHPLYDRAARRIHSTFDAPHEERLDATRLLAKRLIPIS